MDIPINWNEISNNVPKFSLDGLTVSAKVVNVHDGDTIKVVFPYANKLWKWRVRLLDVDTPEVRGSEKEQGLIIRDKLREVISNKVVTLNCSDFDSFGRILGHVFLPGNSDSINNLVKSWIK